MLQLSAAIDGDVSKWQVSTLLGLLDKTVTHILQQQFGWTLF